MSESGVNGVRAVSSRGRRVVARRTPQVVEQAKNCLLLKANKTSLLVNHALHNLHAMKAPEGKLLAKRNDLKPFDDCSTVEFLSRVNECALFVVGSHTKKRPHSLVFGRTFDHTLLDLFEFQLTPNTFVNIQHFEGVRRSIVRVGGKPLILFQGDLFQSNSDFQGLQNLLLDYFRGEVMDKVNLASLDRLIVCTAAPNFLLRIRHYAVVLKKSTDKFPRVELDEVGPRLDLLFRRRKSASDEFRKQAIRMGTAGVVARKKNLVAGPLADVMGRVHLGAQNFEKMATRKFAGLKRKRDVDSDTHSDENRAAPAAHLQPRS